ncbi:helix-turn-helix transcriptional regulator [Anaerofustis butyriciformans]|uniref:helix-turn-helix transcriptional regulator n=1 Tax=Anaerofustis butyriciformans TaxID=3108533 RepID=UPI003F8C30C1
MKNNRYRIFLILKLLYEKSDEENPLTTKDIFSYLKEHNINIDRKTFNEDISFLSEVMGYDIICKKGSSNKYFIGNRLFELSELKMLIDAVSSSFFISKKRSKIIIDKLMYFSAQCQRDELKRNIYVTGKTKTDNNIVYLIVDNINKAINQKKISFKYYDFNNHKEKIFRNNGEVYIISPYALYWNQDKYYVVGYSDKRNDVIAFRVDLMACTNVLEEKSEPKPKNFNISDYGKKIFSMFWGKETVVELKCQNNLMKYVLEKMGNDIDIIETNNETFNVRVKVGISPTFYAWIFQFAGGIKIVSPQNVIDDFNKMLNQNYIGENFTKYLFSEVM